MDCGPTLDVIDGAYEEDFSLDPESVWGRLFPLRKEFVAQSMNGTVHSHIVILVSTGIREPKAKA